MPDEHARAEREQAPADAQVHLARRARRTGASRGCEPRRLPSSRVSSRSVITAAEASEPDPIARVAALEPWPRSVQHDDASRPRRRRRDRGASPRPRSAGASAPRAAPRASPRYVSHRNACSGESVNVKPSDLSMRSMSNAAMITHRNAVWPAAVPADWTMLFSQRLKSRNSEPERQEAEERRRPPRCWARSRASTRCTGRRRR